MKVKLLDLQAQYEQNELRKEIMPVIDELCTNQTFIGGERLTAFEKAIADYSECKYACGVSSGTDALIIALMAEGIGQGDEVITTPFSFFATAGSIWRVGARPVFVDICPDDFNIDPELIESKITPRTKAIMPVHLFGQMAKMDKIMSIAIKHNLVVIEDSAQSIGAEYMNRRAGSFGTYGCFSFYPGKNLGAFGDAGIVTTNDEKKHKKLVMLRNHGEDPSVRYIHEFVGGNFRLDTMQAAVLHIKLNHLDKWSAARKANADTYRRLFAEAGICGMVRPPETTANVTRHIFNQFSMIVGDGKRDFLKDGLARADIGACIYYPIPLHLQKCFSSLGYREGDLPVSEKIAKSILSIPIYPELEKEQLEYVVSTIVKIMRG